MLEPSDMDRLMRNRNRRDYYRSVKNDEANEFELDYINEQIDILSSNGLFDGIYDEIDEMIKTASDEHIGLAYACFHWTGTGGTDGECIFDPSLDFHRERLDDGASHSVTMSVDETDLGIEGDEETVTLMLADAIASTYEEIGWKIRRFWEEYGDGNGEHLPEHKFSNNASTAYGYVYRIQFDLREYM